MKTAIVIPCRGENMVTVLVERAAEYGDVFIADDNAIDGKVMKVPHPAQRVEVPADRHGFSEAYRLGIVHAFESGYDYIVEMDAGGSHNPDSIPNLVRSLEEGADLATGERFNTGHFVGHWKRRLLSQVGTALFNWRNGTTFYDATGGFIAYKREAIVYTHGIPFEAAMHWYQSEVRLRALAADLKIVEVPIVYRASSSTLNFRGIAEAARLLFRKPDIQPWLKLRYGQSGRGDIAQPGDELWEKRKTGYTH